MDPYQSVLLGIVQGLTEFLPVCSSGHLVLLQRLFGMADPALLFDESVHAGTLVAVCAVFCRDILGILRGLLSAPQRQREAGGFAELYRRDRDVRLAVMIVAGSVPTAVLGLMFHSMAETLFGSVGLVGITLMITGTFLWLTRGAEGNGRPVLEMGVRDALVIGLVQGMAIVPGISRSGATISAALFLGIDRETAGRFSFLLSLPAVTGALMLTLKDATGVSTIPAATILAGGAVAAVVGYAALVVLLRIVKRGQLHRFSPYCWLLGTAALGWHFFV